MEEPRELESTQGAQILYSPPQAKRSHKKKPDATQTPTPTPPCGESSIQTGGPGSGSAPSAAVVTSETVATEAKPVEPLQFGALSGIQPESGTTKFHGIIRPKNQGEVYQTFGDNGSSACSASIHYLGIHLVRVHKLMEVAVRELLAEIKQKNMDALILSISAYCRQSCRAATPQMVQLSPTSWGIAFLVNKNENRVNQLVPVRPMGLPTDKTSRGLPGYSFYAGHPLVEIFERHGFVWAGRDKWLTGKMNKPDPALFAFVEEW